ncbi:hypothetical protein PIB30_055593 [Stylosanthes scabra]|uniref:Uncharacterized protein n=1 Tax=Stylosanthes scabra TaxID=79078 RepID=A0ABU6UJ03_9FABA|nr:hypothetical protein [Stylosanthes scabra]
MFTLVSNLTRFTTQPTTAFTFHQNNNNIVTYTKKKPYFGDNISISKDKVAKNTMLSFNTLKHSTLFLAFLIASTIAAGEHGGRKLLWDMSSGRAPTSGTPNGASGSGHGSNWDYSWGWGSAPGAGWGYGSGSGRSPTGFGKGFGYGFGSGTGSGSGSGYGFGFGSGGAHGGGYGSGSGSGGGYGGADNTNRSPNSESRGRTNHHG